MALRVNEYLIIETWNGSGYSYENDAAIFTTDYTAKRIAQNSLTSIIGYFPIGESSLQDGLDINYNRIGKEYKITYTFDNHDGSISVLPYQGQYGVMIKCEINEYTIFNTKEEYDKAYQEAEKKIETALGTKLELMIVASRHRSESGKKSLTVHPIGNYGEADFGGRPATVTPSAPIFMTPALRGLKENAQGLGYPVSFEVTLDAPRPVDFGLMDVVRVQDDDVIVGERRPPLFPTRGVRLARRSRDRDLEHAGLSERRVDESRSLAPVVIAEPVDDQGRDFGLSGGFLGRARPRRDEQADHGQQQGPPAIRSGDRIPNGVGESAFGARYSYAS